MRIPRQSGILLHPTSLPGRFGVGDLGPEAYRFADLLAETGQGLWQVLPLGPTGYGDSPYQCFSAFAGNPLLVSPEKLREEGLLTTADLAKAPAFPEESVDFGAVIDFKRSVLKHAFARFQKTASTTARQGFEGFRREQAGWLGDFALFMALKDAHRGASWTTWERQIKIRRPHAVEQARRDLEAEARAHEFAQYLFFRQWQELRTYVHAHAIQIMGDVPIFVAHDSADVWAHPELFVLAADGSPAVVAGVPPDYFSATGQLWGNPLYRWDMMTRTGYAWWIERFRAVLGLVDLVRLDHFRGFEAYWEVPGKDKTAVNGRWVKGPGGVLFEALEAALGPLPIVAENLGVITPEVEALRERFGFPGMAILQFAFGSDDSAESFKPHNYPRHLVVYTGTHDNDTIAGWWSGGAGDSTRTQDDVEAERDNCRQYLGTEGREIHWAFVRAVLASVADLAVIPLQDVLGLGSEARMNVPAKPNGNWHWRFSWDQVTSQVGRRLRQMTEIYGRVPPTHPPKVTETAG